jgi:modification methylase
VARINRPRLGAPVAEVPRGRVRLLRGDARRLPALPSGSVHLVVTSPPYPMIPQWDGLFHALGADDYVAMHRVLAEAWAECYRLLVDGGLLAVVVGDALRSDRDGFRLWPNHADTLASARAAGFRALPYVLWKKPTNKPNAFLGSGFQPPNAYVTLDCEFVLLLRKGRPRAFPPHDPARAASGFSRAERDHWFSQVWDDVRGAGQRRGSGRSGAFPAEIPRRLVRMFSVVGETVLDPFAGTGTTLWAAAEAGRHAVGVEWDPTVYAELFTEGRRRGFLADADGDALTDRAPSDAPAAAGRARRGRPGARAPRRSRSAGSAGSSR